jgi:5'-3' exonuclease
VSKHERVDNAWVRGKYGVDARQYADLATLRGDASDGLPGVAGIGEKSAAALLTAYGDLDGILAAASDPASAMTAGQRAKFEAAAAYLTVAPQVVKVVRDLELPEFDATLGNADEAACTALAEQYGLTSSMQRALAALSS